MLTHLLEPQASLCIATQDNDNLDSKEPAQTPVMSPRNCLAMRPHVLWLTARSFRTCAGMMIWVSMSAREGVKVPDEGQLRVVMGGKIPQLLVHMSAKSACGSFSFETTASLWIKLAKERSRFKSLDLGWSFIANPPFTLRLNKMIRAWCEFTCSTSV